MIAQTRIQAGRRGGLFRGLSKKKPIFVELSASFFGNRIRKGDPGGEAGRRLCNHVHGLGRGGKRNVAKFHHFYCTVGYFWRPSDLEGVPGGAAGGRFSWPRVAAGREWGYPEEMELLMIDVTAILGQRN